MLLATQRYVTAETFEMEETFNLFPGKAETERRRSFEKFWAVYLWRHALITHFVKKKSAKNRDHSIGNELIFLIKFANYQYIFITNYV